MKFFNHIVILMVIALAATVQPFDAQADLKSSISEQCTSRMPAFERRYGIPSNLLVSIAVNESGIWHKARSKSVPWPWTIGVKGRGLYFATEREAVEAFIKLRDSGVRNMDIGCMQVNYMHHPKAFVDPYKAFDPDTNIGYAAAFLRSNYDEAGSWKRAIHNYHSRTPEFGIPYTNRILNTWRKKMGMADNSSSNYTVASVSKSNVVQTSLPARPMVIKINNSNENSHATGGSIKIVRTSAGSSVPSTSTATGPKIIKLPAGAKSVDTANANIKPVQFIFNAE